MKGFDMLGGMDIGGVIVIIVLIVVALLFFYIKKAFAHAQLKENLEVLEATKKYEQEKEEKARAEGKETKPGVLGTGPFNCMAIRPGNIIDWTTIPSPIGEIYQADTSCPVSGGIYIVRELETGEVVDYDPREVKIDILKTPEWAWSATHCREIVKRFWSVPVAWWRSTSVWFAAAMVVVMFIFGMAALGG